MSYPYPYDDTHTPTNWEQQHQDQINQADHHYHLTKEQYEQDTNQ